jgi:beta-lactamase regulating signal transducer with metallopeptidase domain
VSEAVLSPSEYGYFTHTIFLNKADYTDEELEFILTHELFHYKYGTQWLKLLSELVWILFWWNPIIYIYKEHLAAKIEIYVDSKVTQNMPLHKIKAYLKTIFKVYYEKDNKTIVKSPFVGSLADQNERLLKQRFELLSRPSKNNIPMCLAIIILTCVYLFVTCRYIIQPGWRPPDDKQTQTELDEMVLTPDNSYITYENGDYALYYNGEIIMRGNFDPDKLPDDIPRK